MDQKRTEPTQSEKPELRPDGWDRFERAIDIAAKTPAIRKEKPKPKPKRSVVKRKD